MPTGLTLTASFYDTSTNPETLISAGQAFTEEGSTGVYKRDVTTTLDAYDIVRVLFSNSATAWISPDDGIQEVVSDPAFYNIVAEGGGGDVTVELPTDDAWIIRLPHPIRGLATINAGSAYLEHDDIDDRLYFESDNLPDLTGLDESQVEIHVENLETNAWSIYAHACDEIDVAGKRFYFAMTNLETYALTPNKPHRYHITINYGPPALNEPDNVVEVGRGPCDVGPTAFAIFTTTTTSTTTTTTT